MSAGGIGRVGKGVREQNPSFHPKSTQMVNDRAHCFCGSQIDNAVIDRSGYYREQFNQTGQPFLVGVDWRPARE